MELDVSYRQSNAPDRLLSIFSAISSTPEHLDSAPEGIAFGGYLAQKSSYSRQPR
jgi:hypothetical protein